MEQDYCEKGLKSNAEGLVIVEQGGNVTAVVKSVFTAFKSLKPTRQQTGPHRFTSSN